MPRKDPWSEKAGKRWFLGFFVVSVLAVPFLLLPYAAVLLFAAVTVVVGAIDNFVRPLFFRSGFRIHPLLILIAVFGGISWIGLPGLLGGQVIVAGFMALYTIYAEDFLGRPSPAFDRRPSWTSRLFAWLRRKTSD